VPLSMRPKFSFLNMKVPREKELVRIKENDNSRELFSMTGLPNVGWWSYTFDIAAFRVGA
jgi:hypothetical protein